MQVFFTPVDTPLMSHSLVQQSLVLKQVAPSLPHGSAIITDTIAISQTSIIVNAIKVLKDMFELK